MGPGKSAVLEPLKPLKSTEIAEETTLPFLDAGHFGATSFLTLHARLWYARLSLEMQIPFLILLTRKGAGHWNA